MGMYLKFYSEVFHVHKDVSKKYKINNYSLKLTCIFLCIIYVVNISDRQMSEITSKNPTVPAL